MSRRSTHLYEVVQEDRNRHDEQMRLLFKEMQALRTRDLRRIHTGKRFLGLDDDSYRDLLERLTGHRSAADLNATQRRAVIDEFYRRGFKPPDHRRQNPASAGPGKTRLMAKIEALLADAGRPWAYVDGMAQRMFHLDAVSFCDEEQLRKIVAALVYDQQRRARKIPPDPPLSKGGASDFNPPLTKGGGEAGGI